MTQERRLECLSDDELLGNLGDLLRQSRRVESALVAHIGEVDQRRLYAREASPSMFAFCTQVLHLSEAEAYLRIEVARASRKHPVLLEMLSDGRLHLSGIAKLAPHLTEHNRDSLLVRAAGKSKRQIEELKKVNAVLQKHSEEQEGRLKEMTGQIGQLTKEIPSSLTAQAAQLDELGRQMQRVSQNGEVEQLGKSLADLSGALNLLGEKITAKVDEQEKLLNKTTKRLQALESKLAPKGKQSSVLEETPSGVSPAEAGETINTAWHE